MKNIKIMIAIFIAALLLLFSACGGEIAGEKSIQPDGVYAEINGESITGREVSYFSAQLRPDLMNDIISEYSVEYTDEFWQTSFGGVTPTEKLYSLSLDKCCDAKLLLVLCRENGIYEDISFEALRKKAEKYNTENEGKTGTVGLTSIDMDMFYDYYVENGKMELKTLLGETTIKPTEKEISDYISAMSSKDKAEFSSQTLETHAKNMLIDSKLDKLIENMKADAQRKILIK